MSSYEQKGQEALTAATGSGWVTFGGYMLFVVGIFHVIDGISALSKAHVFGGNGLFWNIRFWGVVLLIVGGLAIYAGWAILDRQEIGRTIGDRPRRPRDPRPADVPERVPDLGAGRGRGSGRSSSTR